MKTRSRPTPASSDTQGVDAKDMENQMKDPVKLMILPKGLSDGARICTLSHPRTSTPCRYYFCPDTGIYEFARIAAPKPSQRSWLLGRPIHKEDARSSETKADEQEFSPSTTSATDPLQAKLEDPRAVSDGYVIKEPELLIATPIDPLFLVLPALHTNSAWGSTSEKGFFLSADDILESQEETSKHFREVCSNDRIRQLMESRMRIICDTVETGDETMFRLNVEKLLSELVTKAHTMVDRGLPRSMEDRFITRKLERPVMALRRDESSNSGPGHPCAANSDDMESATASNDDSQASTDTSISTDSNISTATEVTVPSSDAILGVSEECLRLLRLRTALSYMLSSYVPMALSQALQDALVSDKSQINFKPLNDELAIIAKMRSEALASRSQSDFSRKRGIENDEAAAIRAEKKAKKEEEEKRKKASETRGIRDLKKADTTGMKKMSDFFSKKPAMKNK